MTPRVRPSALTLLLVVGTVLAVAVYAIGPYPVGVFYDDGIYLILAKALASGEGYRYLNIPGQPAATHYPPAYPLFLALIWKLTPEFPRNVFLLKLANAALLAAGAGAAAMFGRARLRLRLPVAAVVSVAFAVAVPVLAMSSVLFSEPLFFLLLVAALAASERLLDADARPTAAIGAGALCGLVALARTIGVAAVAGGVVALLSRGRRATAGQFAAASALVLLPWQLWSAMYTSQVPGVLGTSYGSYVGAWLDAVQQTGPGFPLRVVAHNAAQIVRPLWGMFATALPWWAAALVLAPLLGVLGLGLRRLRRVAPVTDAFLLVYVAIVLLWPVVPDRFLWGIWPLVGLVLALGASELAAWRPTTPARRGARVALAAPLVVAAAFYARYEVRGFAGRWWDTAQRLAADGASPLAHWVSSRTALTDVVATDADPLVYLYTGRPTVPAVTWRAAEYLEPQQPADMIVNTRTLLESFGVRYLLVSSSATPLGAATLQLRRSRPPELALVDTLPGGGAVFVRTRR